MNDLSYPLDAKVKAHDPEPYDVVDSEGFRRTKWRHRVVARWFRQGQEFAVWWWEADDE